MENYTQVMLVLAGSAIIIVFASFLIGFLLVHKSRDVRIRNEKAKLLQEYETTILKTRIEVQEAATKNISAELHDNVGGILSHIKMQLQYLADTEDGLDLRPELIPLYKDLGSAIDDLRNITHTLNGDMVGRMGLVGALRKELDNIRRAGKMNTTLRIEGDPPLTAAEDLLLFRIAQEAVTNAVKHSGASEIHVSLNYTGHTLRLSIRDNGRGISAKEEDRDKGMGLMNMAERAAVLGGTINIGKPPEGGTEITVEAMFSKEANVAA